jgi:hypothetical protein
MKNMTKYINKLKIRATLVLSMKDWKKKISPKISKAHKNNITNKIIEGILLKSKAIKNVLITESMKVIITY